MIEGVRFSLLMKAQLLDRTNQQEVTEYNKLHQDYIKTIYPDRDEVLASETERLFKPWETFFDKEEKVAIPIKEIKEEDLIPQLKKMGIRNLSKKAP